METETYRLGFRWPSVEVYSVGAYIGATGNGNSTDNTVSIEWGIMKQSPKTDQLQGKLE